SQRIVREDSPGLCNDGTDIEPVICKRTENSPPRGFQLQTGVIPKPGMLNISHPGLTSLSQGSMPGMYPSAMYSFTALGAQHPTFAYSGFPQPSRGRFISVRTLAPGWTHNASACRLQR
ncbi:hypothetical protein M9458_019631, partial [Cirrhinus mrigala]